MDSLGKLSTLGGCSPLFLPPYLPQLLPLSPDSHPDPCPSPEGFYGERGVRVREQGKPTLSCQHLRTSLPLSPCCHHPHSFSWPCSFFCAGPEGLEPCPLLPSGSSSSYLSPVTLVQFCPGRSRVHSSFFLLSQRIDTNGLESEEAGISRTPIRNF